MNIVTRGDFDGLASSVLLTIAEDIKKIKFAHPKDVQDGKYPIENDDIIVNLPFMLGCGMWFDHHISEQKKLNEIGEFKGAFELDPSCARVIWNHYKHPEFEKLSDFIEAADKLDSASLTKQDVTNPEGWILLGLTLDPRSGLGPEFRKYFRWLVEFIKEVPLNKILQHREVKMRCARVLQEQEDFKKVLTDNSILHGNVALTDLRNVKTDFVGNRFLVYTIHPEANAELRVFNGKLGNTIIAAGRSIFNKTCAVDIGNLLSQYGGGGHSGAGTCQIPSENAENVIKELINIFNS